VHWLLSCVFVRFIEDNGLIPRPWLRQWHNDYDAEHATRMGDYFAAFVADEARALGLSPEDLRTGRPAPTNARRRRSA
jgi:hypothetical protein